MLAGSSGWRHRRKRLSRASAARLTRPVEAAVPVPVPDPTPSTEDVGLPVSVEVDSCYSGAIQCQFHSHLQESGCGIAVRIDTVNLHRDTARNPRRWEPGRRAGVSRSAVGGAAGAPSPALPRGAGRWSGSPGRFCPGSGPGPRRSCSAAPERLELALPLGRSGAGSGVISGSGAGDITSGRRLSGDPARRFRGSECGRRR